MIVQRLKKVLFRTTIVSALLLLSACQSLSGHHITQSSNLPGEVAQARYAYLTSAIAELESALKNRDANFDNIVFAPSLYEKMEATPNSDVNARIQNLRYMAQTQLANAGHYELVSADTHNGRIEFRSKKIGQYLSVTVSKADNNQQTNSSAFVVTDMFNQVSLRDLSQTKTVKSAAEQLQSHTPFQLSALRRVTQTGPTDDASILSYFNGLPPQERDREDILRFRALLSMRLGDNKAARPLVQSGIVRYPDSPSFFVLAEHLFKRANGSDKKVPTSLKTIMAYRFDRRNIAESRQLIEDFLNADEHT